MGLVLKLVTSDLHLLEDNNIQLRILGSREGVDPQILNSIDEAVDRTAKNTRGTLAVCFNYGGQLEIADACKKIIQSGVASEDVTTDLITQNLYASDIPPLDVVVRTSGEQRLSNFMLWRAAYSELYFTEKHWPDFTPNDLRIALEVYASRARRFGK